MIANIVIKELEENDARRWDDFVYTCPEATFFHLSGWRRVVEQAFGHPCYFLYAEQQGQIQAVLPLGYIRSRLFGHALISFPFCVYGGVAAKHDAAKKALISAAVKLAENLEVDHLELRHIKQQCESWPSKQLYVTFRKEIDPDPEVNMIAIPRKQRAMIRKGIAAGLDSQIDNDIERFYAIYSLSVRDHGTPVFSKRYFELLKVVFGRSCEITVVAKDNHPVSSVMSFYFRDQVLPYYGGGMPEARQYKGFDFMYWELMCRAASQGARWFDYGRSKIGTGSYSFKKNWGFEPEDLGYEYHLVRAKDMPDINPLNPKYRLFINGWKKLPLPLSRMIGPLIAKNLG